MRSLGIAGNDEMVMFLQFPGPNDFGLQAFRLYSEFYPRITKAFYGVLPVAHVHHFDTVKPILTTSGNKPAQNFMYKLNSFETQYLHKFISQII